MELSLEKQAIVEAYERGYRIDEQGVVTSYTGIEMSLFANKKGYLEFAYRMKDGKKKNIKVHLFQAYTKYNDIMLIAEVINHKDGNKINNHIDNIQISTRKVAHQRSVATKNNRYNNN